MSDYDVFLSHNSKDKKAVRELARRLEDRNIRVWFDEDQLIPGRNWQPLLELGIAQSNTGAVVVGKDGLGPWEDEEMQALLRHAATSGKPVIPVLLPRAPKEPKLPLFLSNRTWVDLREGFTDQGMGRLIWGITGTPTGASSAAAESGVSDREPEEAETRAPMEIQELYVRCYLTNQETNPGECLRKVRRLKDKYPHNPDVEKLAKLIKSKHRRGLRKLSLATVIPTTVAALALILVVLYILLL